MFKFWRFSDKILSDEALDASSAIRTADNSAYEETYETLVSTDFKPDEAFASSDKILTGSAYAEHGPAFPAREGETCRLNLFSHLYDEAIASSIPVSVCTP